MIPSYSERDVLESLSRFHAAVNTEIQQAETATKEPNQFGIFQPERHRAIANSLKELAQNLEFLESTLTAVITHSDSSLDGEATQKNIYANRQQIKEIYNETIKKQTNLENKLGLFYKEVQKALKSYSHDALHRDIKSVGRKAKDLAIMNAEANSGLRQNYRHIINKVLETAQHTDEIAASIEGPFSYAGKRGVDRQKIHQQMTGQTHENEPIAKKEFPVNLPTLRRFPRLGSKSPAIIDRTNTICESLKDVIKWKYHKLISKEPGGPSDKSSSEMALQTSFREISDFQRYISKNPKETYISQADELSRTLGQLYNNHFSNSEKVRCAKFFQATNKELERFHKKFKP